MNTNWHFRWYCICGYDFGEGNARTHLMFGFHVLCPKCGESVGSDWKENVNRVKCRWVAQPKLKFNLFNIKTWFSEYKLEVKEK